MVKGGRFSKLMFVSYSNNSLDISENLLRGGYPTCKTFDAALKFSDLNTRIAQNHPLT